MLCTLPWYITYNYMRLVMVLLPSLLRFRTGRPELGYSAHLANGGELVVETVSKGKKPQIHKVVGSNLHPHRWYMLTFSYTHNRVRSSQLCCYVNSRCLLSADVTLPTTDDVCEL